MASVVPGFEYDIFISYRHNDNRSGWVNEFVDALRAELAATIKDPISVYFDSNPQDGLLETHLVDESLEGRIKSLIFIPIVSQTYCDPKAFAWRKEFCVFNRLAAEDSFGRDIKLKSKNVASRILAVKIHELDPDDVKAIETEMGCPLRSVDFIYRAAGVNRPLTSQDSTTKNQNATFYRDQINKVANGAKDLLIALKNFDSVVDDNSIPVTKTKPEPRQTQFDFSRNGKYLWLGALAVVLSGYFIFNFVDVIKLTNKEQMPTHKFILPAFLMLVGVIVVRQPFAKMGQVILQIVAFCMIVGGLIDILFTFSSSSVPETHAEYLHVDPSAVSQPAVSLEFALLRTLGTALVAAGIGAWFLLRGTLTRHQWPNVLAAAVMFTLAHGNDGLQMFLLNMSTYIHVSLLVALTWIGVALWWKGTAPEKL